VVRAPDLLYTGDNRLAFYQGGATLTRPDLTVTGKEIHAYLSEAGADNSLDKALADGTVKITSTTDTRTRVGTSEHAEYYAAEEKVILVQGAPLLVDSVKGRTKGNQLTWWANNDRLLVNGVTSQPSDSVIRKK
jgi:lipopolysaccharide export system protein LptA